MNIQQRRLKIKKRVRSNMVGSAERPRISIFRSNKYIYAQAIDDVHAKTISAVSSKSAETAGECTKKDAAEKAGAALAVALKSKKINQAIFDRGWHGYKGRVQIFADALRKNGITV